MALTDHIINAGQIFTAGLSDRWLRVRGLVQKPLGRLLNRLGDRLFPKGLYARALIIIITPIVLLEGVVAFAFMERHWQSVTRRLSEATARDVAAVIDLYKGYKGNDDYTTLRNLSRDRLDLSLQILPPGTLPPPQPKLSTSQCRSVA